MSARRLRTGFALLIGFGLLAVPLALGGSFLPLATLARPEPSPLASPVCGNGRIEESELCDDGNALPRDGCSGCLVDARARCIGEPSVCHRTFSARCGDGERQAGEQCDDGNLLPRDGCTRLCLFE